MELKHITNARHIIDFSMFNCLIENIPIEIYYFKGEIYQNPLDVIAQVSQHIAHLFFRIENTIDPRRFDLYAARIKKDGSFEEMLFCRDIEKTDIPIEAERANNTFYVMMIDYITQQTKFDIPKLKENKN